MIQIKDMKMPERCVECKICVDHKTNDYGYYGKCLLQDKSVNCLVWSRDMNCPLAESEDEEYGRNENGAHETYT